MASRRWRPRHRSTTIEMVARDWSGIRAVTTARRAPPASRIFVNLHLELERRAPLSGARAVGKDVRTPSSPGCPAPMSSSTTIRSEPSQGIVHKSLPRIAPPHFRRITPHGPRDRREKRRGDRPDLLSRAPPSAAFPTIPASSASSSSARNAAPWARPPMAEGSQIDVLAKTAKELFLADSACAELRT